jgi:hypothetical protein
MRPGQAEWAQRIAARCAMPNSFSRSSPMNHPLSREIEIEPAHTALLFVDVQNYNCTWDGGEYAHLDAAEKEQRYGYFFPHAEGQRAAQHGALQDAPAAAPASRSPTP